MLCVGLLQRIYNSSTPTISFLLFLRYLLSSILQKRPHFPQFKIVYGWGDCENVSIFEQNKQLTAVVLPYYCTVVSKPEVGYKVTKKLGHVNSI